ncbi:MAG: hypothetical protein ACXAEB_00125 [Candidatus Thorarchaeota archaeon]
MRVPLDSLSISVEPIVRLVPRKLDLVLGRILIPSQVSLLHGPSRSPLTALAHSVIVAVARQSEVALSVFLDSGSNFSPKLVRSLCSRTENITNVMNRIIVGKLLSLSDLESFLYKLHEVDNVSMVVLDSLTGVLNFSGAPRSAERQRKLFRTLEVLRETVNKLQVHVLMTDYSSRNWVSGKSTPIGGNVLAHCVDSVVRVDRLDVGNNLIRIEVERSPISPQPSGVILRAGYSGIRTMI